MKRPRVVTYWAVLHLIFGTVFFFSMSVFFIGLSAEENLSCSEIPLILFFLSICAYPIVCGLLLLKGSSACKYMVKSNFFAGRLLKSMFFQTPEMLEWLREEDAMSERLDDENET